MFLYSINASCEGNKDFLCKTCEKSFTRHKRPKGGNKHNPYGNKDKPGQNIRGPEGSLISCFHVDVRVE